MGGGGLVGRMMGTYSTTIVGPAANGDPAKFLRRVPIHLQLPHLSISVSHPESPRRTVALQLQASGVRPLISYLST
jgi:hypothetical protein